MSTWRQQLAPYLILISLAANLIFAVNLYTRDHHLNWITWGNQVDEVWQAVNNASIGNLSGPNGQVYVPAPEGVYTALETLESLRSLPYYGERVAPDDMRTLEHFLRYAGQAYAAAAKEKADTGLVSLRSVERLAKIKQGTDLILRHQQRTNDLKSSRYPWNHAGWRAVWQSIATGLRAIEFIPLDE